MYIKQLISSVRKNGNSKFLLVEIGGFLIVFVVSFIILYAVPYSVPNKTAFIAITSILAFLLLLLIFFDVEMRCKNNLKIKIKIKISEQVFLLIVYILALVTIILANFSSPSFSILLRNIYQEFFVKFVATILITCFLPGYVILKTFSISDIFDDIEQIVYAILLSILLTAFVGFVSWIMGSIYNYTIVILTITNIFILLLFLGFHHKKLTNFSTFHISVFSIVHYVVIALIISFLYLAYFTIHNVFFPLPLLGDEFNHVGYIVKFLRNYYSWQEEALNSLTIPAYPYFFHLFEAVGIVASNLPVAHFYILSSLILLPLPLLAFISLANHLINGNKTLIVFSALVFQLFSGFGWIYATINYSKTNEIASIYSAAVDTNDIIFSTWFPTITAPYLIGLTIFLFTLNLALKKNLSSKRVVLMLAPLLLLGIFSHFAEILFLSTLALILTLINTLFQTNQFHTKGMGIAILLSCVTALFLDKSAPKTLLTSYTFLMPSITLILVSIAITCLSIINVKPKINIQKWKQTITNNIKTITLFLLLLLVFIWILEICTQAKALPHGEVIPLYFMPLKLGTAGLFALIWVFSLSAEDAQKYAALMLLFFGIFLMQLLLYHGPFPLYTRLGIFVEEFRFIRDVTWPVIAIAGAGGIYKSINAIFKIKSNLITIKQKSIYFLLCAFLIGITISSSTLSHLLKTQYMSNMALIKEEDFPIIQFMENVKVPSGSSIFAPTSLSEKLYSVTGAPIYTPQTPFYGNIISNSKDISNILLVLKYLNVSYVVTLRSDKSFLTQTLQYFPKIYSDYQYDVYKISDYLPPSNSATTMLLASNGNLAETILNYGFEGTFQWVDEFYNINGWQPDLGMFLNVINHTVVQDNNIFRLEVKGVKNSKIVAFYKFLLTNWIFVDDNTYVFLKFKTSGDTRLLVHILYDDGTIGNTLYMGSVYMNSKDWAFSITKIEKVGRYINGFRIGVSNLFNQDVDEISAEVDFLIVFKSAIPHRFNDAVAALSLAKVNYTITYELDIFNIKNYKNIVVIDEGTYTATNNTLDRLLQLAGKGHTILILGNFSRNGLFSQFIDFTGKLVPASLIKIDKNHYYIYQKIYVEQIQLHNCEVLASYETEIGSIPLIVKLNNTNLYYMNIWPILDAFKNSSDTILLNDASHLLRLLFETVIDVYTEDMHRAFYLKNIGPLVINGTLNVSMRELFFTKEFMAKFNESTGSGLTLEIDGSIELNSYKYGYSLLIIYGKVSILLNGSMILCTNVDGLKILAKVSTLEGYGRIEFSSLTSAAPYRVILNNVKYDYQGYFSVEVIPFSNNLLFVYPRNLNGFLN